MDFNDLFERGCDSEDNRGNDNRGDRNVGDRNVGNDNRGNDNNGNGNVGVDGPVGSARAEGTRGGSNRPRERATALARTVESTTAQPAGVAVTILSSRND